MRGIALAVVGACWLVATVLTLRVGSPGHPDAGLWPVVVASVLSASGVILAIRDVRARSRRSAPESEGELGEASAGGKKYVTFWVAWLTLVPYLDLFWAIGFAVPTLLLMVFWLKYVARESWRMTLGVAFGFTAAMFILFVVLLRIPLPYGPLRQLMGI